MSVAAALRRESAEREAQLDELRAEAERVEAEERRTAIMAALALYDGSLWARASALETNLNSYLGNGWPRERFASELHDETSSPSRALHRVARSRDGNGLKARRIFDIARNYNFDCSTLQKLSCESFGEAQLE